jgi:TetR/AcrR family transcriptional regulator
VARTGGSERRKALVAEAIRLFGAHGYDGASLEAVAEAAGVRKQTLLYYFPTKEELFESCIVDVAARISSSLEEALEDPSLGWHRAEDVIRAIFRLAEEWPAFPMFLREASRRSPQMVGRFAGMLEPLRKRAIVFLERGMDEGVYRRQDPVLLLFTLYTAVVGSLTEAGVLRAVGGVEKGRGALKRREEELIEFVRGALRA